MQPLLVVSGYGSIKQTFYTTCYGGSLNNPAIMRCVVDFVQDVVAARLDPDSLFLDDMAFSRVSWRRAERTQVEKRIAKRINNKRRRAEDKREIEREMGLLADDRCASDNIEAEERLARHLGGWGFWRRPIGCANVFVPAAQECFDSSANLAGAVADMARTQGATYCTGYYNSLLKVHIHNAPNFRN